MKKLLKKIYRKGLEGDVPARKSDCVNCVTSFMYTNIMLQNGKIWSELLKQKNIESIQDAEFKVFSQWGDDGIIQYLINYLDIKNKTFIEFGVEDYQEANTRFLLINNNWSGLVMDGNENNIVKIKSDEIYWKYDLEAKAAFITAENINQLIKEEGIDGEIGLLHIDIDGNDYWIWKALEVVNPIIVIVEYNSVFGSERAITIPYKADFNWTETHYSNLYFGASIPAFYDLAKEKGYDFIGCNSAGNNAYFVKKDSLKNLKPLTVQEGFVKSKFRQSRDQNGNLNYLKTEEQFTTLKELPVYNTRSKKVETI
ncbi:hypothetical protein [Gramella sp. AN32]|uniref:NADH dehydrogenase n=1 Tax=Christiangramia antarctica TaxID=2058158 RepID=A0ABW5X6Q9_9FLAO|nr:hypothetical protein [Gramella sp. AN32]